METTQNEGASLWDGSLRNAVEAAEYGMQTAGSSNPGHDGVGQTGGMEERDWGETTGRMNELSIENGEGSYQYEHLETEREVYVSVTVWTGPDYDEISLDLNDESMGGDGGEAGPEVTGEDDNYLNDLAAFPSLIAVANGEWMPNVETDDDLAQ